jgi:hypothetical protein
MIAGLSVPYSGLNPLSFPYAPCVCEMAQTHFRGASSSIEQTKSESNPKLRIGAAILYLPQPNSVHNVRYHESVVAIIVESTDPGGGVGSSGRRVVARPRTKRIVAVFPATATSGRLRAQCVRHGPAGSTRWSNGGGNGDGAAAATRWGWKENGRRHKEEGEENVYYGCD